MVKKIWAGIQNLLTGGEKGRPLGVKLRLTIMGVSVVSLMLTLLVFDISTTRTQKQIFYQETSSDLTHIQQTLESRAEVVQSAAQVLAHNKEIVQVIQTEADDMLEVITSRAVLVRERFHLDLVQIYNQEGIARANIVSATLFQVSYLKDEVDSGEMKIVSSGEHLILVSRLPMDGDVGFVITGLDLGTELSRIVVQGNLNSTAQLIQGEVKAGKSLCDEDDQRTVSAYCLEKFITLGLSPVQLEVTRDTSQIREIVKTGRGVVIGSVLGMTILVVTLSEILVRAISKPLKNLVAATEELTTHQFNHSGEDERKEIVPQQNFLRIGYKDEIGQLAESFSTMEQELSQLYLGLLGDLEQSHHELETAYEATLKGWSSALELRDHDVDEHTQRVKNLTVELAVKMNINGKALTNIRWGALLHDVGKLAIPDEILRKPAPLTPEEWTIMRQHPIYAYAMLRPIEYLRDAISIPYCHHENWDGSGYPRGLVRYEIPFAARIFSVVDVWDSLTTDRPYRKAWPEDKALNYIKQQTGIKFDPEIVEVFMEWIQTRNGFSL